jgi:hypothetical protein
MRIGIQDQGRINRNPLFPPALRTCVPYQQTNFFFPRVSPLLQLCSHTFKEAGFFDELVKKPSSPDELRGRIELGNCTMVKDDDPVGIQDRIYAMCDSYDGPIAEDIAAQRSL